MDTSNLQRRSALKKREFEYKTSLFCTEPFCKRVNKSVDGWNSVSHYQTFSLKFLSERVVTLNNIYIPWPKRT